MDGESVRHNPMVDGGTVSLAKVSAAENCADIVTKCLVGEAFFRHRKTVLGLD